MIDENENKSLPSLTLLEEIKLRQIDKGDNFRGESLEPCYLSLGVTHSAVITRSGDLLTGGSKLDG